MEPISFIDNLIKGVVLVAYDFVTMTCYAAAIPFVRKTRRFWPTLVSEQKYLSPLTYLVFWTLLTAALALRSGTDLAANAVGIDKEKGSTPDILKTIVVALAFSILADIVSRACLWFLANKPRRRLYDGLMRIAVANVFVAACALMVFAPAVRPLRGIEDALGPILYLSSILFPGSIFWLPNPVLILLSGSLGIVFVKAMAIRDWRMKWIAGTLFTIAVPTLLLNLAFPMFRWTYEIVDVLAEGSRVKIYASAITCHLTSDQIRISGYLRSSGTKVTLLNSENLAIYDGFPRTENYVATIEPSKDPIIISESTYTLIDLEAKYDRQKAKVLLEQGEFDCALSLLKRLGKNESSLVVLSPTE
jgi:hypothetical protein